MLDIPVGAVATHDVTHQVPALHGHNAFRADPAPQEAVEHESAGRAEPALVTFGGVYGVLPPGADVAAILARAWRDAA